MSMYFVIVRSRLIPADCWDCNEFCKQRKPCLQRPVRFVEYIIWDDGSWLQKVLKISTQRSKLALLSDSIKKINKLGHSHSFTIRVANPHPVNLIMDEWNKTGMFL